MNRITVFGWCCSIQPYNISLSHRSSTSLQSGNSVFLSHHSSSSLPNTVIICYINSITTNREFFSDFLVKQTRAGGLWEAVAPLSGGRGLLGGRPLRCRATGPLGASAQILSENFCRKAPTALQRGDQVPAARQQGGRVYFCKFRKRKYIFVKNKNEKYKNIKIAWAGGR